MNYNEERIERAKALIDLLKKVPEDRFDLNSWAEYNDQDDHGKHICKTSACAMGWAAGTPEVAEKLGIAFGVVVSYDDMDSLTVKKYTKMDLLEKFLKRSGHSYEEIIIVTTESLKRQGERGVMPFHNNCEGFDAAARAFFIDNRMAQYLFNPNYYKKSNVQPRDVIKRLRKIIKKSNKDTDYAEADASDFGISPSIH